MLDFCRSDFVSSCLWKRKFKTGFTVSHTKAKSRHSSVLKIWRGQVFPLSNNQSLVLLVQFTQMGEFASLFFMLLGMIPWDMRAALSGGVPCRVWKRSFCRLLACWQVRTAVLLAVAQIAALANSVTASCCLIC